MLLLGHFVLLSLAFLANDLRAVCERPRRHVWSAALRVCMCVTIAMERVDEDCSGPLYIWSGALITCSPAAIVGVAVLFLGIIGVAGLRLTIGLSEWSMHADGPVAKLVSIAALLALLRCVFSVHGRSDLRRTFAVLFRTHLLRFLSILGEDSGSSMSATRTRFITRLTCL